MRTAALTSEFLALEAQSTRLEEEIRDARSRRRVIELEMVGLAAGRVVRILAGKHAGRLAFVQATKGHTRLARNQEPFLTLNISPTLNNDLDKKLSTMLSVHKKGVDWEFVD